MDADQLKKNITGVAKDLLMALAIVAVIMGALMAYCQVWPPMVVVESGSMMHDDLSHIGVIDTGDMVLVKKVSEKEDIMTYGEAEPVNFRKYSSFGDVIIYRPNGDENLTPIIHRAILWVEANDTLCSHELDYDNYTFDVPAYNYYGRTDNLTVEIDNWVGDRARKVPLRIVFRDYDRGRGILDRYKGLGVVPYDAFLTMGDHNSGYDQAGNGLLPVKVDWVIGKAAGELPWFGLIKLGVTNDLPGDVPSNSWTFLIISIALIIGIPLFVDLGLPPLMKMMRDGDGEETDGGEDGGRPVGEDLPEDEGVGPPEEGNDKIPATEEEEARSDDVVGLDEEEAEPNRVEKNGDADEDGGLSAEEK